MIIQSLSTHCIDNSISSDHQTFHSLRLTAQLLIWQAGVGLLVATRLCTQTLEFSSVDKRVASLHFGVEEQALSIVSACAPNDILEHPVFPGWE